MLKFMVILLILSLLTACSGVTTVLPAFYEHSPAAPDKPLSVVVTFDALYEFASAVGGGRMSISQIIPNGADAHRFEPAARDFTALNHADVFIMSGLGFEPWAQSAVNAAGHDGLIVVDASGEVEPITVSNEHCCEGASCNNGSYDPHIWLSLTNAAIMTENITAAFIRADPDGANYFAKNRDAFISALEDLFQEYYDRFSALENRTIVTSHAIFAYLCRDFGLYQVSISGVFAAGEPTARALSELVEFCRQNNITTVLTEYLKSPLVAETLANEIGGTVKTIFTIESAEAGMSYLDRMAVNLAVIYESLTG